jgi:hypothetical protein
MPVDIQKRILSKFYSLDFKLEKNTTTIHMSINDGNVTTFHHPQTMSYLKALLPAIFRSQCRNYINSSFEIEVQNTEIAHLFEHILIVYLYEEKIKTGVSYVKYDGVTKWKKSSPFEFKIIISSGENDNKLFLKAFRKSIDLLNRIISNKTGSFDLPVLSRSSIEDYSSKSFVVVPSSSS